MKSQLYIVLFLVVALFVLIGEYLDNRTLTMLFKPLIIPSLFIYAWRNGLRKNKTIAFLTFSALLFSWFGDILLMFQANGEIYFLLGLGAFLLAHIFYILDYRKARATEGIQKIPIIPTVTVIVYIVLLFTLIYNNLNDMKLPVLLYALVISVMLLTAIYRRGSTSLLSFGLVAAGSAIFVISDSLIALNKFWQLIPAARISIMFTYMLAQYLIVQGLLKHIIIKSQ